MSRARPRLVFVVNYPIFFLSHRLALARRARAEGYDVILVTPDLEGVDQIRAEGFPWFPMRLDPGRMRPYRDLVTILDLYRLFSKLAPDIVHNVTIKPVLYGTLAASLAGVPRVVNAISGMGHLFSESRPLVRRFGAMLYRLLMRHRDMRIILQNAEDFTYFKTFRLAPLECLRLIKGSGVDTEMFAPRPKLEGPPVVMQTSRMIGDKGVHDFTAAARLVKARRPEVKFLLVGPLYPDNPTAISREELDALSVEGVVQWLGGRNDIPDLLPTATIYVLASAYKEGVPKALIEAAACALPIVTTDIPGCREVIIDGDTGLLVPPKNAPALAMAIERLLADPELARALGRRAREHAVKHFSLDLILRQQIALYDEPSVVSL